MITFRLRLLDCGTTIDEKTGEDRAWVERFLVGSCDIPGQCARDYIEQAIRDGEVEFDTGDCETAILTVDGR